MKRDRTRSRSPEGGPPNRGQPNRDQPDNIEPDRDRSDHGLDDLDSSEDLELAAPVRRAGLTAASGQPTGDRLDPQAVSRQRNARFEESAESMAPETRRERAKKKLRKLVFWLVAFGVFLLLMAVFQKQILALLKRSSTAWAIYTHMAGQVEKRTLLGLFYAGFFGSLFFIMVPLEAIYFYYLSLHHPVWVVIVMQIASVLGLCINYMMGAAMGERILERLAKERYAKIQLAMGEWGAWIVMLSNVIPILPVQLISLIIGSTRFGLKRFLIYTFIGRLAYLIMLYYTAGFVTKTVWPFFRGLFGG